MKDDPVTPKVEETSIEKLDELVDLPEVSEHAIDAQKERDKLKLDELKEHDSSGVAFDPSKHGVDRDDNPLITKTGRYRKIRKSKSTMGHNDKSIVGNLTVPDSDKTESLALGIVAAGMTFTIGTLIGGSEWQPKLDIKEGIDEKAMLTRAYGDYFLSTGRADFPPVVALTVALLGYASLRFGMPKTKSRFKAVKDWIMSKIFKDKKSDK